MWPNLVSDSDVLLILIMDTIKVLVVMVVVLGISRVQGLMVMDEPSCHDVEEAECGVCHTLYMEDCKMEMVPEMMPKKVSMCRNVTRWVSSIRAMLLIVCSQNISDVAKTFTILLLVLMLCIIPVIDHW